MWQYGWQYMTKLMIVLIKSDNMDDIANKWQYMTKWMIVLRKCDNMDGSANMWQYGWQYMTIWTIVLIKSWEVGVELRSRNVREYYRVHKFLFTYNFFAYLYFLHTHILEETNGICDFWQVGQKNVDPFLDPPGRWLSGGVIGVTFWFKCSPSNARLAKNEANMGQNRLCAQTC